MLIEHPFANSKAFVVWFKDLERWDCSFFRKVSWLWPKEFIFPLSHVLHRKLIPTTKTIDTVNLPIIEKITFGGVVSVTDVEDRRAYKGRLFWAERGDLIYSKIRAKQGSLAIVPHEIEKIAVSAEYPVYSVDSTIADSNYLSLVLRNRAFLNLLEGLSHGGSTKTRIPPEQFERLEIPLPPLHVQQAIVDKWQRAQEGIKAIRERVENIKQSFDDRLLKRLGLTLPPVALRKGAFALDWKDFERWDTFFYREDFIELERQLLSIRHARLGEVLNFTSRSWKTSDYPDGTFEYVEISSVTKDNGIIGSRPVEVKQAPSRATTLIKEGDIIIATTRPYLGAFAVVPEKYNNCVCSSGFSLADSIKIPDIEKEFLLLFLKSPAGLRQMERRMTGGLYPAIVQDELEKILVPIPSPAVQQEIIRAMKDGVVEIEQAREAAEQKSLEIKAEIEAVILGTKRIQA
jgi:type I restriction enzyme S subunit